MKPRSKILVAGGVLTAVLIAVASLGAVLAWAAGDPAAGKTVFTSSGCGGCHTLADADAKGKSGPNFDTAKPGFDAIVSAVTNPPSGMPKSNLTDQQIQDLAAYIVAVAGNQAGGGTGDDTGGGGTGNDTSEGGETTGGGTSSTVRVTLKGWKIKLSPKEVTAGVVTFKVRNAGGRRHQLSVIRSSRNPHTLSVKRGRVSEADRMGKKIKRIRFKHRRKASRDLSPGTYILIDNRRGNYKKGRFALLTVTEPPSTGQGTGEGAGQGTGQSAGEQTAASDPQLSVGAQAFLDAGCGGCHTLADAGATGMGASSLDIGKPSLDTVTAVVTNGITNSLGSLLVPKVQQAMPAFNTKLTAQEIEELATYVSTVTGGGDGSTQTPGRQSVLRMGCGSCHTLGDAGVKGDSWSNLDIAMPSKATVAAVVPSGIKNYVGDSTSANQVMPAYSSKLTDEEIRDVGNYVSAVTGGGKVQPTGRQAFEKGGCGSCHALADTDAKGTYSSDFGLSKPDLQTLYNAMSMGLPGQMPTYPDLGGGTGLTSAETSDIAKYVSSTVGGVNSNCQACHAGDDPELRY